MKLLERIKMIWIKLVLAVLRLINSQVSLALKTFYYKILI
jgi:hypothetical protein